MPNRCVLNFAKNGWYPSGQARLRESLARIGFTGQFLALTDESQVDAPPHAEVSYAFKPAAILRAAEDGYNSVLYCDASVWAIRSLDPVFDAIAQAGHLFFYNCSTGPWSSDGALQHFGVTRDQAFDIPMLIGGCMGFDLRNERTLAFLERWRESIPTFAGSWTNEAGQVSHDPRVKGHRHDQTAASLIAHQLGMGLTIAHETFLMFPNWMVDDPLNDQRIRPTVCLLAQGM